MAYIFGEGELHPWLFKVPRDGGTGHETCRFLYETPTRDKKAAFGRFQTEIVRMVQWEKEFREKNGPDAKLPQDHNPDQDMIEGCSNFSFQIIRELVAWDDSERPYLGFVENGKPVEITPETPPKVWRGFFRRWMPEVLVRFAFEVFAPSTQVDPVTSRPVVTPGSGMEDGSEGSAMPRIPVADTFPEDHAGKS